MRVIEFHCGIGGCATALRGSRATIVAAVDINLKALAVYRHNEPSATSVAMCRTIESLTAEEIVAWGGEMWWMSPPCQPHTTRGAMRGLGDTRSESFVNMMTCLGVARPRYIAMENVPGFVGSDSHDLWRSTLERLGYALREWTLCPSELGWPTRRARYFAVAAAAGEALGELRPELGRLEGDRSLAGMLSRAPDDVDQWLVPEPLAERYAKALHVVDPADPAAYARCFTSAYGKSPVGVGSYVMTARGPRYFTPREIACLMGFPRDWSFPEGMTRRESWALIGNSLAIPCVRSVLGAVEELGISKFNN